MGSAVIAATSLGAQRSRPGVRVRVEPRWRGQLMAPPRQEVLGKYHAAHCHERPADPGGNELAPSEPKALHRGTSDAHRQHDHPGEADHHGGDVDAEECDPTVGHPIGHAEGTKPGEYDGGG